MPAVRARERRRRDRLEPVRGDRALVRARARSCSSSTTPTRRSRPTATLLDDPAQARGDGRAGARARARRAHVRPSRPAAALAGRPRRPGRRTCLSDHRIAIVPAHNEEEAIGRVVEELRAFDPELDVVVIDDGSEDATAARAAAAGAAVVRLPFNLGIGGAVQTGFKYALDARLRHGDPARRRRPARPAADPEAARAARPRRGRRRRRLALRRGSGRLQAAVRAPRRDPLVRAARLAADAPEADRHDVRLPGRQRAGDPALRRRLSARLPRGRGGRDGRAAPAADPGGAGADARPRDRPLVDHDAALPLLRDQGDAGAARRHLPPSRRPPGGAEMDP